MAKYDVTYSCGHTDTVQLYGKNEERERKLKWMENSLCPECYKKWKCEDNKQKAKEILGNIELPNLTGTEKQIAYAESLRDEYIIKDNMAYSTMPAYNYVTRLYRFLNSLTFNDVSRWDKICEKRGVTKDEWKSKVILSVAKAYACLTETNAGKLINTLKDPATDRWLAEWDERAIYTTPQKLIEKYGIYLVGDEIASLEKNQSIKDGYFYAAIMYKDEIIAILRERDSKADNDNQTENT